VISRLAPLVFRNLFRNRRRTALTVTSIAFFLFLFTALFAVLATFSEATRIAEKSLNLMVRDRYGFLSSALPISYLRKVTSTPGVRGATPWLLFFGSGRTETDVIAGFGCEPDVLRDTRQEYREIPETDWRAFLADRSGCLMGRAPMNDQGWRKGDRVTVRGMADAVDLEMTIRGVIETGMAADNFLCHYDYLNEVTGRRDVTTFIFLQVDDAEAVSTVPARIDEAFSSQPVKTKTEPEQAFMARAISLGANVHLVIYGIAAIVIACAVLVTANSIAMSARERTLEIAVMKTLGFGGRHVLLLVVAESALLALLGGVAGCLGTWAAVRALGGFSLRIGPQSYFTVDLRTALDGVLVALAIGVAAGVVPAIAQARRRIVDTLRSVA
jgi:putative ABC transport system permease protein